MPPRSRQILVAGAGVAGLTAALAFARHGYAVRLFERAPVLAEVGAGLQLSPNATRLLDGLGLGAAVRAATVRPDAILLRDARSERRIARIPLGQAAEARWEAPYLVAHRADLQRVLVEAVEAQPDIRLEKGASIEDAAFHGDGVTASLDRGGRVEEASGLLLVGADGVWSRLRERLDPAAAAIDTGYVAWRSIVARQDPAAEPLAGLMEGRSVAAFLDPHFHLVAYPLRGGREINLVAVTPGGRAERSWSSRADPAPLRQALAQAGPALAALGGASLDWMSWPVMEAPRRGRWTHPGGLALIGDAAHAMSPYAAQGAAMAVEDAVSLAHLVAEHHGDVAAALSAYEEMRRPRIARVRRRGGFNRFVWHANGPVRIGRDTVLAMRAESRLAADLDWLYGWGAGAGRAAT